MENEILEIINKFSWVGEVSRGNCPSLPPPVGISVDTKKDKFVTIPYLPTVPFLAECPAFSLFY